MSDVFSEANQPSANPPKRRKAKAPTRQDSTSNAVVVQQQAPQTIVDRAFETGNLDVIQRAMELQERFLATQAKRDFDAAMANAQSRMRPISANASNPQTRSRYATYAKLDKELRPIYTEEGFALTFDTADGAPDNFVRVVCLVACKGHRESYHLDMPADGKGAKGGDVMTRTHATGSAVTYGRRYLLKMIFNIAEGEDDDGNAAARVAEPVITAAQVIEAQKAVEENKVPDKIMEPTYGVTYASLDKLKASDFTKFIGACGTYGKRAQQ